MITSTKREKRRKSRWPSRCAWSSSSEEDVDVGQENLGLGEQIKKEAIPEELNAALEKYWNHIKPPDNRAVEKQEVEEIVRDVLNRIESKDLRFKMDIFFRGNTYENINLGCAKKSSDNKDFEPHHLAYYAMLPLKELAIEEEFQIGEQADTALCTPGKFGHSTLHR